MKQKITISILSFFLCFNIWAQKGDSILKNEQIDIIKAYEPILIKANKVIISPKLPELKTNMSRDLEYNVPVQLLEVEYQPPSEIKPLSIKTEPKAELPILRLKAGFGNYLTPLIDLDITNKNTEKYRVGLNIKHLSSKRKKVENQSFNESAFNAFGEYNISEEMKVGLSAQYNIDNYFFYGYNHDDTSFTKKDSKIGYNTGGFNLNFEGEVNDLDLEYDFDFSYLSTKDSYNNKSGLLNLSLGAEKSFYKSLVVGARLGLNSNKYKEIFNNSSRTLFNFNPYFGYDHQRFNIHAGLTLLTDEGNFGILPDIKLQTVLIPGALSMYNHWTGDINYNNLYSFSTENPWLQKTQNFKNGTTEIRTFLGLTGNIAKKVDYDVRISQLVYKDKLLFVNDTTEDKKFVGVYDSKLKAWNPHVMVGYNHSDFLFLKLSFDYFKYNTSNQGSAWHLPTMVSTFSGVYHFNHKLILKTDLFVEAGRKTMLIDGATATLKPIADLNLGVNYYFNKNIGLFASANNVLSLKRMRYRNYNMLGFQVLGGVIVSF